MEIRESQGTLYSKGPAWGVQDLLLIPIDSATPGRRGRLRIPQPNWQDRTVASSGAPLLAAQTHGQSSTHVPSLMCPPSGLSLAG